MAIENRVCPCRPKLLLPAVAAIFVSTSIATGDAAEDPYFATLKPGEALPSGSSCAHRVRRSPWEPRPQNDKANRTPGGRHVIIEGASASFNSRFGSRVDGNFTGSTNEIIQWGACKWGFDEEITRARAVQESYWRQSKRGDQSHDARTCKSIGKTAPCWQS